MESIESTEDQQDLQLLLQTFAKYSYEAGNINENDNIISDRCEHLFKLDYNLIVLDNQNGCLSPSYPAKILIPEYEKRYSFGLSDRMFMLAESTNSNGNNILGANGVHYDFSETPTTSTAHTPTNSFPQSSSIQSENNDGAYDPSKVREIITMARYARCRQRFTVPVILFRGKFICRSATISVSPETYGRKIADLAYDCISGRPQNNQTNSSDDDNDSIDDNTLADGAGGTNNIEASQFSYTEVIKSDVQLMNVLNVKTIVDLMVELKKVKYCITVSSSEKADTENHYKNFDILSLPYPGCEFFKEYRSHDYFAHGLQYNWSQSFIDASLSIPKNKPIYDIGVDWSDYRKWDLVQITQHYLKLILKYIKEENFGLLIHCISGWDRTPLFISLVRLSIWADGLIHQSLTPSQILYFTTAYDWYLFGHQLPDRLKRGEDIMLFCFDMLKYIASEDYSISEYRKRTKTTSSSGSSSIIVLKSDYCEEDSFKEDCGNSNDQENSNDSFSSNCDMSTEHPNSSSNTTSRSPNPKRSKSSPISVPRKRQESTSSNASWHMVTNSGSIDSNHPNQDLSNSASNLKRPPSLRQQKLNAVRETFRKVYGKAIGYQFQDGSSHSSTLYSILKPIS